MRREHPHRNLPSSPCCVENGNRSLSPLGPADDLKGNSMERVERVEDLDMSVLRAQGIVGADDTIPISTV